MAAEQIAPADLAELKRVRPLVKEHCAICFQPRACRVQYLERPMIGKVCTNKKCLLENAERKAAELLAMQEQLVQVRAVCAAQGVRALAQAAASRKLRVASTGPVRRRADASAAQTLRDDGILEMMWATVQINTQINEFFSNYCPCAIVPAPSLRPSRATMGGEGGILVRRRETSGLSCTRASAPALLALPARANSPSL